MYINLDSCFCHFPTLPISINLIKSGKKTSLSNTFAPHELGKINICFLSMRETWEPFHLKNICFSKYTSICHKSPCMYLTRKRTTLQGLIYCWRPVQSPWKSLVICPYSTYHKPVQGQLRVNWETRTKMSAVTSDFYVRVNKISVVQQGKQLLQNIFCSVKFSTSCSFKTIAPCWMSSQSDDVLSQSDRQGNTTLDNISQSCCYAKGQKLLKISGKCSRCSQQYYCIPTHLC